MWTIAGKTVLITGATRGIGLETAVSLAAQGARPILVGRDAQRLARAVDLVTTRVGVAADARLCDLSSLRDVGRLADAIRRDYSRLDVLINNAGGVHRRRTLTADELEATFATNHLSHFLLTTRLLDRLVASAPARVITVASDRAIVAAPWISMTSASSAATASCARTADRSWRTCCLRMNCLGAWPARA